MRYHLIVECKGIDDEKEFGIPQIFHLQLSILNYPARRRICVGLEGNPCIIQAFASGIREFLATVVLASFFVATASMSTRAQIVFDEEFNFREFRFNPPPNYTQGPDLLGIGISVIDITTGQSPALGGLGTVAPNGARGHQRPLELLRATRGHDA